MILPIYAYGQPVLKQKSQDIQADYAGLAALIENMWETMYDAHGVGLAAPQIGRAIRLFVVDTIQIMDDDKKAMGIKQVFINAQIMEEEGEPWTYEEGCLSIPDIRGDVDRKPNVRIRWQDEQFQAHERVFTGMNARVIQHEYDHIEGILFTEHLSPLKKRLIQRRLDNIKKGKISSDYKMRFYVPR